MHQNYTEILNPTPFVKINFLSKLFYTQKKFFYCNHSGNSTNYYIAVKQEISFLKSLTWRLPTQVDGARSNYPRSAHRDGYG